jgi:hypothetical protein
MSGRLQLLKLLESFPVAMIKETKMCAVHLLSCGQFGRGFALAFDDMMETRKCIHTIGGKRIE